MGFGTLPLSSRGRLSQILHKAFVEVANITETAKGARAQVNWIDREITRILKAGDSLKIRIGDLRRQMDAMTSEPRQIEKLMGRAGDGREFIKNSSKDYVVRFSSIYS